MRLRCKIHHYLVDYMCKLQDEEGNTYTLYNCPKCLGALTKKEVYEDKK